MAGRAYRRQTRQASNGLPVTCGGVDRFAPSSGTVPVVCRVCAEMGRDGAGKDWGVSVRFVLLETTKASRFGMGWSPMSSGCGLGVEKCGIFDDSACRWSQ